MQRVVSICLAVLLGTAYAKVWYVHPDSTQDSIQPCLDACGVGDTVLVAAGIYHEKLVWPNTQGIGLLSESGPDSTIIDGDSSGIVITINVRVDTTTAIEGLTVTGGFSSDLGGGMLVWNGSPMIRNNTLTGNVAKFGGGIGAGNCKSIYIVSNRFIRNCAVYGGAADIGGGTAYIIGNLFEQNRADTNIGGVVLEQEDGLVQGNSFVGNYARYWHGALVSVQGNASISGNTFAYDSAGYGNSALFFWDCGDQEVTGNTVRYCRAQRGAAICCDNSSTIFVDDTVTDNTALGYDGAILCTNGATPHFSRCLIAGNSEPVQGALVTTDSSSPVIDYCTIAGNECAGVYAGTGSHLSITHCNIYGNLDYGIDCEYYADSIDACNNWWGDSTGPFHPDSNPGGLGNAVSDGVFFRPWLRDSVLYPGVCEYYRSVPMGPQSGTTIVRSVLCLARAASPNPRAASLIDISGRKVLGLKPGANDVRELAPGVYFVRERPEAASLRPQVVQKVIVTR